MQSSSLIGAAFFSATNGGKSGCSLCGFVPGVSTNSNTAVGHTSMHTPSAIHISKSTATVLPSIPNISGAFTGP